MWDSSIAFLIASFGGANVPDVGRRAALDADDAPLVVFGGIPGHEPSKFLPLS